MSLAPRVILWILPWLVLAGCSDFSSFFDSKPKSPPAPKTIPASSYVLNLSLAQLALENDPADMNAVKPYLKIISNKINQKDRSVTLLALEYKLSGQKNPKQKMLLIPVTEKSEFADLKKAMESLSRLSYVLQNLHTYHTELQPAPYPEFSKTDSAILSGQIYEQQRAIRKNARALKPLEDARLQLRITEFFMKHRIRDAAYFSLDNVKRTLAQATQHPSDKTDALSSLSQEAEALENRLHKELPYKL